MTLLWILWSLALVLALVALGAALRAWYWWRRIDATRTAIDALLAWHDLARRSRRRPAPSPRPEARP